MSKNLDKIVRLQSEKRVDARDKRKETTRDYGGTSSAPCLASSSAASFPGRVFGDPLQSDRTGGERRQVLPDLPLSLRSEERWRRGQGGKDRTRVR